MSERETARCPKCGRRVSVDAGKLCQHGPGKRGEFLCPGGGATVKS